MDTETRPRLKATFDTSTQTPEVAVARFGLTKAEVRSARRALRRGEAAPDPRTARLVMALAEQRYQKAAGTWAGWMIGAALDVWAVATLVRGDLETYRWFFVALAAAGLVAT